MIKDVSGLLDKITTEIRQFTDRAVIGLSGGADSTLVACLCVKALGKENVYGVHMPYGDVDTLKFNKRSRALAEYLQIRSMDAPIFQIASAINNAVGDAIGPYYMMDNFELSDTNKGNSRSRSRMCVLYGIAHHIGDKSGQRVRVMGTSNLSEIEFKFI